MTNKLLICRQVSQVHFVCFGLFQRLIFWCQHQRGSLMLSAVMKSSFVLFIFLGETRYSLSLLVLKVMILFLIIQLQKHFLTKWDYGSLIAWASTASNFHANLNLPSLLTSFVNQSIFPMRRGGRSQDVWWHQCWQVVGHVETLLGGVFLLVWYSSHGVLSNPFPYRRNRC